VRPRLTARLGRPGFPIDCCFNPNERALTTVVTLVESQNRRGIGSAFEIGLSRRVRRPVG